jgi:hypothetical protein
MKTHTSTYLVLLLVALSLAGGSAVAADFGDVRDTLKEVFKVRPGGTLYLDMDRGNIEIVSRRGNEVLIEMERLVDSGSRTQAKDVLEGHRHEMTQRGNDIHVSSRVDEEDGGGRRWGRWRGENRLRIRVVVQVPERYNIEFTTGAGNVRVNAVEGLVKGRTGAGNIVLGAVRGPVDISSGSGNVDVEGAVGRVAVSTGAGNIKLLNLQGDVRVSTGAGNIEAEITRQPEGDSRLESGAGNVTVFLAPRIAVDAEGVASVGSASTDFPLRVDGKWMRRSFEGPINGGGPSLRLRAGVGNVSLRKL